MSKVKLQHIGRSDYQFEHNGHTVNVFKVEKVVYYTLATKTRGDRAHRRYETHWVFKIDDSKAVYGSSSRSQAIASAISTIALQTS